MFPRRLLEHSTQVRLPAFTDSPLYGLALAALDKIDVLTQNRKPERQVLGR